MIKAIIFDCFGVLVGDAMPLFVEKHFGHSEELTAEAWQCDDRLNLGEITIERHYEELSKLAGISTEQVIEELDQDFPNTPLLNYIRHELKPHYKIGILSNIHADILDELIGAENRDMFDAETLSYKVGYVKPAPEIYAIAADSLGVTPQECVFIDDKQRYCDAATSVGMRTIVYRNLPQFTADITRLLQ